MRLKIGRTYIGRTEVFFGIAFLMAVSFNLAVAYGMYLIVQKIMSL